MMHRNDLTRPARKLSFSSLHDRHKSRFCCTSGSHFFCENVPFAVPQTLLKISKNSRQMMQSTAEGGSRGRPIVTLRPRALSFGFTHLIWIRIPSFFFHRQLQNDIFEDASLLQTAQMDAKSLSPTLSHSCVKYKILIANIP